jgi:hypothetical protein
MTDIEEPRVDLSLLGSEARFRAEQVAHRVMQRIEADADSVSGRLARLALPALLAAAASLVLVLLSRPREPQPNPFAVLVVGPGPARSWVIMNRAPDLNEVQAMMGGGR